MKHECDECTQCWARLEKTDQLLKQLVEIIKTFSAQQNEILKAMKQEVREVQISLEEKH